MTIYEKVVSVFSALRGMINRKANNSEIAPEFSEDAEYLQGEMVMHDDKLYQCISDHHGPWDDRDFDRKPISDIVPIKVSELDNDKGYIEAENVGFQFRDISLSDNATQADIRKAVQDVIAAMKSLSAPVSATCLAAMIATSAIAAMPDDDTKWEDVGPTNLVKDVVVKFSPTPDFSTSNTALVHTIELKAPPPSMYAAVSNAAMNARANTDLQVYTNILEDSWHYVGLEDWFNVFSLTYEPGQAKWHIVASGTTGGWFDYISVDGQYDDMSLTFTVTEGGGAPLGRTATVTAIRDTVTVASEDMLATTSNVAEVKQMIHDASAPLTVAMFVFPVNDISNDAFSNKWDNVVLYASTNNFQGHGRIFEAETSVPEKVPDRMYTFFHAESQFWDWRTSLEYTNSVEAITNRTISSKEIIAFIDTNCCGGVSSWLREDNRSLVFEWSRILEGSGTGTPKHEGVWRVIRPIQWFEKMPKWAEQQVYP